MCCVWTFLLCSTLPSLCLSLFIWKGTIQFHETQDFTWFKKARISQKACFHLQSAGHDFKSNKMHLQGKNMVRHLKYNNKHTTNCQREHRAHKIQHNTRYTHSLYNKDITTYRLITISLRQSNTVVPLFCPVIIGRRDKYWAVTAFNIA